MKQADGAVLNFILDENNNRLFLSEENNYIHSYRLSGILCIIYKTHERFSCHWKAILKTYFPNINAD